MVVYLKNGNRSFIKLIKVGSETNKIDVFAQNDTDFAIDVMLDDRPIDEVYKNLVQGQFNLPSNEREFNEAFSKCISIINKANNNE